VQTGEGPGSYIQAWRHRLQPADAGLPAGSSRRTRGLRLLNDELSAMTSWLTRQDDLAQASAAIRRFGTLIQASPSLRAHQSDMMYQFIAVAAEILAARVSMSPDDPEPQIAATALLGLWRIQFQALLKYLDGTRTLRRSTRP
jgi:hypothetical protein